MTKLYTYKNGKQVWKKYNFEVDLVDKWEAPTEGGVPIITMPNIPKPLHGPGMQPRTVLPSAKWETMKRMCKYRADYKCEVCGCEPEPRNLHAHELFSYDYKKGEGVFVRCVALCERCHVRGIHSGRMLTLYKHGDPQMPKSKVLDGIENVFRLVSEWNKTHDKKLKVYSAILSALDFPTLTDEVQELINKYQVDFYTPTNDCAGWDDWHVVIDGKAHYTRFKDEQDWEKQMKKYNEKDPSGILSGASCFQGGVFDEVTRLLADYEQEKPEKKVD